MMAENGVERPELKVIALNAAQKEQDPFRWLGASDIFKSEMGAPTWVIQGMEIGPGRPCGLWGYGGSGKSYIAMAIALCVASGKDFLGFSVSRGKVRHLSHEMGKRALFERYRRLANGMLIEEWDLQDMLSVSAYPKVYLNDPKAEEVYTKEFQGVTLCVLDSFRRALPGEDENDSSISNYLDMLGRVSDATGCTFLVLHHCGKGGLGKDGKQQGTDTEATNQDKRGAGRGSSAIEDGSGSIWLVEGSGVGPRKMSLIRAHEDGDGSIEPLHFHMPTVALEEPFYVAAKAAMRLEVLSVDKLEEMKSKATVKRNTERFERGRTNALAVLKEHQPLSWRDWLRKLGDSRDNRELIEELEEQGYVVVSKGTDKLGRPNPKAKMFTVNESRSIGSGGHSGTAF